MNNEEPKITIVGDLEEIQSLKENNTQLEKRVETQEEVFYTFSKLSLKVTHVVATTLQFIAQEKEKEKEGLDMEDTKILYKFLAGGWAKVLLDGKGKKKMEN